MIVEEPFTFSVPDETPTPLKQEAGIRNDNLAGDGYYISATNNTSRYYGILVSQEALKAASLLHFREEAESLDLNRRIESMKGQKKDETSDEPNTKRQKSEIKNILTSLKVDPDARSVQKFHYVPSEGEDPGYRILIATYVNEEAAADFNEEKKKAILKACNNGGDFVGSFYYQYENLVNRLNCRKEVEKPTDSGFRMSMGFEQFLQNTQMPVWFPLSIGQHKVLSMLNMKHDGKGGVKWKKDYISEGSKVQQGTHLPMEKRSHFRVGIIGGGIAGLACATEIIRRAEENGINIQVVVLEARSRLGGRLKTDFSTFHFSDGSKFPVDLGASWIHGIDQNPLAATAKSANIEFVTASEDVKMIKGDMQPIDIDMDEYIGKIYDKLLDQAADDVWESEDYVPDTERSQLAVRWYAEALSKDSIKETSIQRSDAPPHRHSSDVSIDHALGKVVSKHNHRVFRKFGTDEQSLLLWNTKNVEYALGANISDLSMKFWDSDERHAFEGDHVLLKQGYSTVIDHMKKELVLKGEKFKYELDFPVEKIEYARKSETLNHPPPSYGRACKLIELSDACCVTSREGRTEKFDFVVSTLPLGVLKQSVQATAEELGAIRQGVIFEPPLPFPKIDAIRNTGFGLLNKVYLQFPKAFWRIESILDKDKTLFGNVSGIHPHHYMFFDVGKSLGTIEDQPPILMTLISGAEAVACERLTDQSLVNQVLETLRKLYTDALVSDPVAFKITRWGSDEFSRGCYTFLPPGATDQDFQLLQSPINGNGDSLTLEGSETMRLFWAGEHTTALHPSMAHGAMLSGVRAAEQIMSTIKLKSNDDKGGFERLIPMAIFRKKNPRVKLECSLCHLTGNRVREGSLLALQKGSRQFLVHNNCGQNSPEVEIRDGQWKSTLKAINRGKQINCCMCGHVGATIGCSSANCVRCFHFGCAEDTGWRFSRDGKAFFCDIHRNFPAHGNNECDQISLKFYKSKNPHLRMLFCAFCGGADDARKGKMLAFSQQNKLLTVHDHCARYTNILETLEDCTNLKDTDFKNLFQVIQRSKQCKFCKQGGATIKCAACDQHYHFLCAENNLSWNFVRKGNRLICPLHEKFALHGTTSNSGGPPKALFQHNLFFSGAARANGDTGDIGNRMDVAVNDKVWETIRNHHDLTNDTSHDMYGVDDDLPSEKDFITDPLLMPICGLTTSESENETLNITRSSLGEPWTFDLSLAPSYDVNVTHLIIELPSSGGDNDNLFLLQQVNEKLIGTEDLSCTKDVIKVLRSSTAIKFEAQKYMRK